MSTNSKPVELPDIKALEKLANEYFAAVPGAFTGYGIPNQQVVQSPVNPDPLLSQGRVTDMDHPQTSMHDPHFPNTSPIPKSVAGSGISPSALEKGNVFNLNNLHSGLFYPNFVSQTIPMSVAGTGISPWAMQRGDALDVDNLQKSVLGQHSSQGVVPSSVAGSGISPSVTEHGKTFNVKNPQTSLPDPHFAGQGIAPSSVAGSGISPSVTEHGKTFNVNNPQTSLPDPHFAGQGIAPSSVAGSGISPSVTDHDKTFNVNNPQTSLPDPHFAGQGVVPNSVAGSGISPSVAEHGKAFTVNSPQTSLPDPHFASQGIVPKSVAGSGFSPAVAEYGKTFNGYSPQTISPDSYFAAPWVVPKSLSGVGLSPSAMPQHLEGGKGIGYSSYLPLTAEQPYETELREVLNAIHSFIPVSQLPFADSTAITDPSFYFLSGKDHLPLPKEEPGLSARYLAVKETAYGLTNPPFDVNLIKRDFPILQERVNGKPLIWLDNAATTQKPKQVIDRISYFYEHENSNIHRAAHVLAARATDAYENARKKVQHFLNAGSVNEIIFVRGATEAINLVAKSWGEQFLKEGDEIILSHLEHHANIVPWQQLAAKKGLKIRVIPVDDDGQVLLEEYGKLLGPKTKLVSFAQVSNALGTVTPAKQIVEMAHHAGARVLVDGAQSVSHMRVDVQALNCDWFVFSGHKIFGPTGIGVVYGKESLLNETQPWQGGGNMIVDVTFEHTKFHNAPGRYEAGTGNIADAVGLGAAIDYVSKIGMDLIHQYEHYLLLYATKLMKDVPGLRLIGTAPDKASVLSFVFEGFRTEEVGAALNQEGIAVRAGHHCAQPILRRFGVETTVRPSLALYNTCADVDKLVSTLLRLRSGRVQSVKK